MKLRNLTVVLLPVLLAACTGMSPRERDADALARHLEFASAPVDSFTYLGRIDGWRPLGEDQLVVYTGVNDAYLITVGQPCRELEFARSIGLTSTGGRVSARFDSVKVDGDTCMITQIRPVDYGAVKQAAREEREASRY